LRKDIEDIKFAVAEHNIEEVRNRINHVKEISSKAVVEAKEIEGKHAALYNLMMQDISEVDDQIH